MVCLVVRRDGARIDLPGEVQVAVVLRLRPPLIQLRGDLVNRVDAGLDLVGPARADGDYEIAGGEVRSGLHVERSERHALTELHAFGHARAPLLVEQCALEYAAA